MIKKLLERLRGAPPVTPAAPATPTASDDTPPVRWLTKGDPGNPFNVDGFDCFGFVSSMLSTTKDPAIATSFSSLRSDEGLSVRGTLPDDPIEIPCALSYEFDGGTRDGPLFKSQAMEEKWDLYLYDQRLYFCRSWTGALTFVAEIKPEEKSLRIPRLWASGPEDTALAIQQVDYLIKSHLYQQRVPHPLPPELPREPTPVALYSFSQYGRLCCFGSFESTLGDDLLKR
ncbi:MAG: hypothetical protein ABW190_11155 [Rhizobacter sp.]